MEEQKAVSLCVDAEQVIEEAYHNHIVIFRDFVKQTNEWLIRYEYTLAPLLMQYLSSMGEDSTSHDTKLLNAITHHAEAFVRLSEQALAEYEEAYKVAKAVFGKVRSE